MHAPPFLLAFRSSSSPPPPSSSSSLLLLLPRPPLLPHLVRRVCNLGRGVLEACGAVGRGRQQLKHVRLVLGLALLHNARQLANHQRLHGGGPVGVLAVLLR